MRPAVCNCCRSTPELPNICTGVRCVDTSAAKLHKFVLRNAVYGMLRKWTMFKNLWHVFFMKCVLKCKFVWWTVRFAPFKKQPYLDICLPRILDGSNMYLLNNLTIRTFLYKADICRHRLPLIWSNYDSIFCFSIYITYQLLSPTCNFYTVQISDEAMERVKRVDGGTNAHPLQNTRFCWNYYLHSRLFVTQVRV